MLKFIWHLISGVRKFQKKIIKDFLSHRTVVEVGSGEKEQSCEKYFHPSNFNFIKTDLIGEHEKWDITKKQFREKVDIILCLNVLEHVFEVEKAINNIYKSLRGGMQ